MTLTLADRWIKYPYGVLKDVLVRVDVLLFPTVYVNLDMPENSKMTLLLGRLVFAISKALIDVALRRIYTEI